MNKDIWIGDTYNAFVDYRISLETNNTLKRRHQNEYGDSGLIKTRFHKNLDCQNAFKNFFCYINFPRCDPARDLTLPTCRSVCENFFKSCGYAKDLWRCGRSKYFNGYAPESPIVDISGNVSYLRDYFPGQPFRKNEFNKAGHTIAICTPSILGSAYGSRLNVYNTMALMVFTLVTIIITSIGV